MRQADRRARTRQRLLDAAADVFARVGFHAATVDDVAEAAGLTKGAVYANFAGKDALFLALLDRHLDDQLAQVDRLLAAAPETDVHTALHEASSAHIAGGGSFGLLMLELWLYAARDEQARAALAARYERVRHRLAGAVAERDATRGTTDPRAPEEMATLVLALDAGLFLQHLVDPGAVAPDLRARALAGIIDGGIGGSR